MGNIHERCLSWKGHLAAAGLALLSILTFFYAPRAGSSGPGLWDAVLEPSSFPPLVREALLGSVVEAHRFWVGRGLQGHPYLPYLRDYLATIAEGAPWLAAFAVVGFLVDRYSGDRPRGFVTFTAAWGLLMVAGYPVANFLPTPWSTVHAVVPLAVPAAVGVAAIFDRAIDGLSDGKSLRAAVSLSILLLAAGTAAATGARTCYLSPHDGDSQLVYSSQPGDFGPELRAVERAVGGNEGTDVMFFGDYYAIESESIADRPPAYGGWHNRLPLPWYLEAMDAEVASTTDPDEVGETRPPVVIARYDEAGPLEGLKGEYVSSVSDLDQLDKRTVFLVRRDLYEGR